MSKASEWARAVVLSKFGRRPRPVRYAPGNAEIAAVRLEGSRYFLHQNAVSLTPGGAMKYARWILDTFGEVP